MGVWDVAVTAEALPPAAELSILMTGATSAGTADTTRATAAATRAAAHAGKHAGQGNLGALAGWGR